MAADDTADHTAALRWRAWAGDGLEHLVLRRSADAVTAESVVIGDGFALRYRLRCDGLWRVRRVEVEAVGGGALALDADGQGRWTGAGGAALPNLDGAVDVDLSATPFTNTLPIRRLALAPGRSAGIRVAYVDAPGLAVSATAQRYTCLEARLYRFESLDDGFTRDIEVDADGLVVTYPGLFRRA